MSDERLSLLCSRSLRLVIRCLLNSYKEDFHEPPRYSTLTYLMKQIPDRELQHQCQKLLEQFKDEEDADASNVDKNNNFSLGDHLYSQRGFDYVSPWSLLDMPSAVVAEQLTIVDAVCSRQISLYDVCYVCFRTYSNVSYLTSV